MEPSIDCAFEKAYSAAEDSHSAINDEINAVLAEIKELFVSSELKLIYKLEDLINDRVALISKGTYRQGFKDAYRIFK
ncbi:hypothetical protein [Cohnella thailandensis]|uniref:Uncharacterized protein n=1 Tax=Cohnella thailandensis TaxID=557557 RepID=A0A841SNQ8_9BACL|nr:hypothetical protein [Cohnella thailandensis]MBB6633574.1 hypothetical protein [Cohnella thailandensis]MBP1974593.1 hypothetical protein [Cohnella thailandensis]